MVGVSGGLRCDTAVQAVVEADAGREDASKQLMILELELNSRGKVQAGLYEHRLALPRPAIDRDHKTE